MWNQLIERLPIIMPSVAATLFLAAMAGRGLRRMWHLGRKANQFFDLVLGNAGQPSIMDRMASMEDKLDGHLQWHGHPAGRPAGPDLTKPNGPTSVRRRRN